MTRSTILALVAAAGFGTFALADGCGAAKSGCGDKVAEQKKEGCGDKELVAQYDVTKKAADAAKDAAKLDIVDTALANKDFSTLVTALKAADLVTTLKGKGPFTVFAPTNAAFEKLPKETLAALLKPEAKSTLAGILTYHVIAGDVKAADAIKLDGKMAKTVNGAEVKIVVKDGKVFIGPGVDKEHKDMAQIVKTDIVTSNGVIHVLDAVILPPAKSESKSEGDKPKAN
ncbi:MAG: fasciclin domain-containing protein [Phycisphaerales bacterium]|jgi:uncharacterized surface protein with fasciclin (FAS1) repeats|nr:fasciclin domain-containing protein [Phycisphaerales bacterium]